LVFFYLCLVVDNKGVEHAGAERRANGFQWRGLSQCWRGSSDIYTTLAWTRDNGRESTGELRRRWRSGVEEVTEEKLRRAVMSGEQEQLQ
jgi:hypothetical protein